MKGKQIIALVIGILLVFAFVGCSPAQDATDDATDNSDTTSDDVQSDDASQGDNASDETSGKPAADVAEVGFDFYEDAVTWAEAEEMLGPIPKPTEDLTLGFVCKAFENEFWRTNKEGAEAAAAALNEAGINVVYDVRAAQGEADEQGQLAILN